MSESVREGGCLCGQVRYTVRGEPLAVEYCHCGMCRKVSGAPVTVWADFPSEALRWNGDRPAEHGSSPEALRGFCPSCGGTLSFRLREGAVWISIAAGSLDDPGSVRPTRHIYEADRIPWLHMDDDLARFPERPPPS